MTYLSFLVLLLLPPLSLALAAVLLETRRGRGLTALETGAIWAHVALAVVYTTPWDNYLVATGVWTYAPTRVLGLTLGWVPLEEYLFFVLQTLLTGLLVVWLARRRPVIAHGKARGGLNLAPALVLVAVWAVSVFVLVAGWKPGTYLSLELVWALLPIALQLAVGADVLWRRRWAVLLALLPVTLYLCVADRLAIRAGVWTIAPAYSLNVFLGGLPFEEAVFFLVTNTLVVFGITLALAPETRARWEQLRAAVRPGEKSNSKGFQNP